MKSISLGLVLVAAFAALVSSAPDSSARDPYLCYYGSFDGNQECEAALAGCANDNQNPESLNCQKTCKCMEGNSYCDEYAAGCPDTRDGKAGEEFRNFLQTLQSQKGAPKSNGKNAGAYLKKESDFFNLKNAASRNDATCPDTINQCLPGNEACMYYCGGACNDPSSEPCTTCVNAYCKDMCCCIEDSCSTYHAMYCSTITCTPPPPEE